MTKSNSLFACERALAWAPSNIALVKYWGKRDHALNLPTHGSLSLALGDKGTWTELSWDFFADQDFVSFNEKQLNLESVEAARLLKFLDRFRPAGIKGAYRVRTCNNIPTAAGLASSASGFAALVKALNKLHGWNLDSKKLSVLARIGSGSACRSLYAGFAIWHEGKRADGEDSYAESLDVAWPGLRWLVFMPSKDKKELSSREAMKQTAQTCPWFNTWVTQSKVWLEEAKEAVLNQNFTKLGQIMEASSLMMHASMLSTQPWNLYWKPQTVDMMHRVRQLRQEGVECYLTMDAGPSVKILYFENDRLHLEKMTQDLDASSLLWVNPWSKPEEKLRSV